jgi:protein-tyrosine phosphatase
MTESFAIATVPLVGNARLGLCPMPGRNGDIAADMAQIEAWFPQLVVSMTPGDELKQHGANALFELLQHAGIPHSRFPVEDYGIPDGVQDWAALSRHIHHCLDTGGSVLVHCAGGCGRSGMAVLRLMIERGEAAPHALERLRQARPCAVETTAQMQWAFAGA